MVLTERHFRPCPYPDNTFKIILVCCRQKSVAMYYSWNTSLQLISCLTGFFLFKFTVFGLLNGSRVYPVRIQGTESVATIDWSFLPQKARRCPGTRIYFGTSPRPARINLISFLGGSNPCKGTPQSTCTILEQNYSNARFIMIILSRETTSENLPPPFQTNGNI